jgi:modification methylase
LHDVDKVFGTHRWARIAAANIDWARRHGAAGDAQVIQGDARQLRNLLPPAAAGTAALILTSPPYGPSIHGQVRAEARSGGGGVTKFDNTYGTDPANLASRRLDDLLAGFGEILTAARTLLRPGGTVVITTRPWRQRGELVDFPAAVLAAGTAAGLIPADRCVALLAGMHGSRLIARPSFFQLDNTRKARAQGKPWHLIAHEDVLVFREPGNCPSSGKLKPAQYEPKYSPPGIPGPGTWVDGEAERRAA